ncbi:hypothetical protein RRG08_003692 [Elysia crispata]|uniref:Uncharacterized protein n=1 Tax=Elysia crispata TaxID=231223 RepID=A0AAE1AVA3_9GAST|nr:hypothetical protein RRG08_003692 [Elysia crispata]
MSERKENGNVEMGRGEERGMKVRRCCSCGDGKGGGGRVAAAAAATSYSNRKEAAAGACVARENTVMMSELC